MNNIARLVSTRGNLSLRRGAVSKTYARLCLLLGLLCLAPAPLKAEESTFQKVAAILQERCLDCHSASEPDGNFSMETYSELMKGGESGPAIVAGKSAESLLVKLIEGSMEKDGKARFMPPGKREKLSASQVEQIRSWIDAGAKSPSGNARIAVEVTVPKIIPKVPPPRAIYSMAYDSTRKWVALGRMAEVEIVSAESQLSITNLPTSGSNGSSVNAVVFSPDGAKLFAAGGPPGIKGEIWIWNTAELEQRKEIAGHADSIYALAVSPDGKMLASGSYDQKIKLWDLGTGTEVRTLSGHNGCVYALAFRADGKLLASASGDRTVKLWDVESGARRDTLSQPLKEQYALSFSPDGKRLAAAGVDNRVRVWEVSEEARETTNPLLHSKFAHEGPILRLAFSADGKVLGTTGEDRKVKLWDATTLEERRQLEPQSEWAPAIAFIEGDKGIAVGRLDGSLGFYDAGNGAVLRPPRPEVTAIEPRGVQRGKTAKLKVAGKNLATVTGVRSSNERIKAELGREGDQLWVNVTPAPDLERGPYDLYLVGRNDESQPIKMYVDDIPQLADPQSIDQLPVTIWGTHGEPGDKDSVEFTASEGETVVFDAAAKSIGSKADLLLTLSDSEGKVITTSSRFDDSGDPLIAHRFSNTGRYRLIISELVPGGSSEHFYRVAMGAFPFVTGVAPPVVAPGGELELIGYNLSNARIPVAKTNQGDFKIPLSGEKYRWRGDLRASVVEGSFARESEPNDSFNQATLVSAPTVAAGRIATGDREDWYRFEAKNGQTWVIETMADRIGSPLDTKVEVRDAAGKPIVRTILQAVRASAVTFRGIDSTTIDCRVENWEEMELNEFLYLQGEVVRLFRAPQGPDSGFNFYALNGKRRNYFDTTASAHANAEPCYTVKPHRTGEKLSANGLPTFPVYFENDDDAERKLGTDSKVYFTAPADGVYHVKVSDTRGFSGERFVYRLDIREARPDFSARIEGMGTSIAKGSGQRFTVNVDRMDGFEGAIKVELPAIRAGFSISHPVSVQEGHTTAFGTIYAAENIPLPELKFTASAQINGMTVTHPAGTLTNISVTEKASLYVDLEPAMITIAPGETVPAMIKIRREGHNDLVTFQVENLPHGLIVDNIGLNGVLIPKDQNEREIFIRAAKWVPETDRYCYAISNEAGRQTSRPVLIKVRKSAGKVAAN